MSKNYYTPAHDGIAGLEEFGDIEHGSNYEQCRPVDFGGKRVVGSTYEPALVFDYFRKGGTITHGGTVIAHGALRFNPVWDFGMRARAYAEYHSSDEGLFNRGCSRTRPANVGDYENDER